LRILTRQFRRRGKAPQGPPNDYFDTDGNYLGSDNRGDEIKIVSASTIEGASKLSYNKKFSVYNKEGGKLSKFSFLENESALGNIGQYYLDRSVTGDCGILCVGSDDFVGPMSLVPTDRFADYGDKVRPFIQIYISSFRGTIADKEGPLMDNFYNFSNMLYHEYVHYVREVISKGNGRYKTIGTDMTSEKHRSIFEAQEKHWTWEHTTPDFKKDRDDKIKEINRHIEKNKN
jgi:hypothetical protein